MQHLWYDEHPEFHGVFADFAGVDAHPRPVQKPVPIVVGGHTPAAYRRSVAVGHGWYGFAMTPETVAASLAGLRDAATHEIRHAELGELEITVTPRGRLTPETAAQFAELGVHRLVVIPPPRDGGVADTIAGATAAIAGL
jgi:alkanesulfonate monooxygenase SsuD/methylene tetrahydromethanopterin reductase-like flavin-dependent oxidoreductase (luciferase family)